MTVSPAGRIEQVSRILRVDIASTLAVPAYGAAAQTDPQSATPEQFSAFIKAEIAKGAKVVQSAGIRIE